MLLLSQGKVLRLRVNIFDIDCGMSTRKLRFYHTLSEMIVPQNDGSQLRNIDTCVAKFFAISLRFA